MSRFAWIFISIVTGAAAGFALRFGGPARPDHYDRAPAETLTGVYVSNCDGSDQKDCRVQIDE